MTMGEKILNMRKARGWSQEELAERVGVTRQAVSRWEQGSAKPDADKIISICELFGVSADYLLRDIASQSEQLAPEPEAKMQRAHALNGAQLTGVIMLSVCLVLTTILAIVGSINGGTHYILGLDGVERVYTGMMAFVTVNNLEWLLWLFGFIGLTSILLMFSPWIRRFFQRAVDWFRTYYM